VVRVKNGLAPDFTKSINDVDAKLCTTIGMVGTSNVDSFLGAVADVAQLIGVKTFVDSFSLRRAGGLAKGSFGDVGAVADGSCGGVFAPRETLDLLTFGEFVEGGDSRGGEEEVDITWRITLGKCCY
jgi:hypothetical protein